MNRTVQIRVHPRNFERMGAADGKKIRGSVDGGWPALLELFAAEAARTDR